MDLFSKFIPVKLPKFALELRFINNIEKDLLIDPPIPQATR